MATSVNKLDGSGATGLVVNNLMNHNHGASGVVDGGNNNWIAP